jgi:hypothetical protein
VLAAETPTAKGSPARSDSAWIFEPGLSRSTGFGPVSGPPFSPGHSRRQRPPATSRSVPDCQFIQHRSMQLPLQAGLGPLDKPSVRSGDRNPETGRQMPPRTAARQHEHDRGKHRLIVDPRHPTTLRAGLHRRDQGFTSAHSSSGTNRRDNSSTTSGDHESKSSMIQVTRSKAKGVLAMAQSGKAGSSEAARTMTNRASEGLQRGF